MKVAALKQDNSNINLKLALRRYLLTRYHAGGGANVLDCCQGEGELWRELQREFPLAGYWGVDVKPKRGRLRIDSVKILSQPGWDQNVIDIDTYGRPWHHWFALLPHVKRPLTVFMTVGTAGPRRMKLTGHEMDVLGITNPAIRDKCGVLTPKLSGTALHGCLAKAAAFGLKLVEAVEAVDDNAVWWRTRYIGVHLEPA
jgi:hypothetical protein